MDEGGGPMNSKCNKAEHLMSAADQHFDQLRPDEPRGVGDKRGRPSSDCHAESVK